MKDEKAKVLNLAQRPDDGAQFRQIEKKAVEILEKARKEGRRIKFCAVLSEDEHGVTRFDWSQMDDMWEVLGMLEMLKFDMMKASHED